MDATPELPRIGHGFHRVVAKGCGRSSVRRGMWRHCSCQARAEPRSSARPWLIIHAVTGCSRRFKMREKTQRERSWRNKKAIEATINVLPAAFPTNGIGNVKTSSQQAAVLQSLIRPASFGKIRNLTRPPLLPLHLQPGHSFRCQDGSTDSASKNGHPRQLDMCANTMQCKA